MKEKRARWIFALGFIAIILLAFVVTVILAIRYVKPTDKGDWLGLLIGAVFWPILAIWWIGGVLVLRRYRSRRP